MNNSSQLHLTGGSAGTLFVEREFRQQSMSWVIRSFLAQPEENQPIGTREFVLSLAMVAFALAFFALSLRLF